MTPEQVQQGVDRWFVGINAMDVTQYLAACADDAILYDPVGAPPLESEEARRQFYEGVTALFERVSAVPENTYIVGNDAAVNWTIRATAKNGKTVEFGGIDVLTFNDEGRVKGQMSFWDPTALMAQIDS